MRPPDGASAAPTTPDCLACGTCCFSRLATYVPVTGDDHARLADEVDRVVEWHGNRAYMRMEDGHCAALRLDATAGTGAFVCTVYDARPETCRALARGSAECAGELAAKRDRPAAALVRLRIASTDDA